MPHSSTPRTVVFLLILLARCHIRTSRESLAPCLLDVSYTGRCHVGKPAIPGWNIRIPLVKNRRTSWEALKLTQEENLKQVEYGACDVLLWQWYWCSALVPRSQSFFFSCPVSAQKDCISTVKLRLLDELNFVIQICYVLFRRTLFGGSDKFFISKYKWLREICLKNLLLRIADLSSYFCNSDNELLGVLEVRIVIFQINCSFYQNVVSLFDRIQTWIPPFE